MSAKSCTHLFVLALLIGFVPGISFAQSGGTSGTVEGVVKDPSGAVVPKARVEISYGVSGLRRETTTGDSGEFRFTNLPFNPYHLVVTAPGFAAGVRDVDVRSAVPASLEITLKLGAATAEVAVHSEGSDLVEAEPNFHTDIDRRLFQKLPLESQSSSISSLVTLASPGAVADSNGLVHGLGDHAENSFSVDGQPITDQFSKVFSNQIPVDAVQALEVISGAPPAEYGGKTSLVIKATTRSGLGQHKPTGEVSASYGTFGTVNAGFNIAVGSEKWGNFLSVNGLHTGRFLDAPEFEVFHAKGNQQNIFNRVDFQLSQADTLHMNFGFTRSWFQTPNSFDAEAVRQDQRSQIRTFNIAPSWTHLFNSSTLLSVNSFVRRDNFQYFPSRDPFADQPQTLTQDRKLTNAGIRADLSYVKGVNNVKAGIVFQHTLLTESFGLGLTDPALNDPCVDASGAPAGDPALTDPGQCGAAGFQPNAAFLPILACFDLSRPTPAAGSGCANPQATLFNFHDSSDIKEVAFYAQDTITAGNWSFNLGLRLDLYRGISRDTEVQPRLGVAYNIKKTSTVLRASYARLLESPFNENLLVASTQDPVIDAAFGQGVPIRPGTRNEFHVGLQQAFGKFAVVDFDYLWKYTHNAYDFGVILNSPIFFPISWHNSKIGGPSVRISVPDTHGFTAFVVMGSAFARFFEPQLGGLGASPAGSAVFRIDHDQKFQQTTHVQYQPWKRGPWLAFNWRYDSGLVAGEVPVATDTTTPVDLSGLTGDQQLQAGLFCGSLRPTFTAPLSSCAPQDYGSTRIKLPAPGTVDDDHNPPRVRARHLFDLSIGHDNLFQGDRYKWGARVTVVNLADKVALYNFLSTFSGTHFVTPRTVTGQITFNF